MDLTKGTRPPGRSNVIWPGSLNRLNKAANFGLRISFGGQGLLSCLAHPMDEQVSSKNVGWMRGSLSARQR